MDIEINLTGGTSKNKSLSLSAQRTINWLPKPQDVNNKKSPYTLETFPGKKLFGTVAGSRDRGMKEHLNVLYKVTDTTLYTVATDGTHTSRGTIAGSGRCIIEGIGTNVVIVSEGNAYLWNGSTLSSITDPDLETPNSVAHIRNIMIYDGDNGRAWVSDFGDATTIDSLSFVTAESNADDLLRVYIHDQNIYMMGDKTIEPWWYSGVGIPPIDPIQGAILEVGLGAIYSVANSKNFVYFVGNDNIVYAMNGSDAQPVFNDDITAEISEFSVVSDAQGMCYNINKQWYYEISFPTANRTFVFPEGGQAFELSSTSGGTRNIASSYAYFNRKHLVGDINSGNIYELDFNTYTDNGETIIRTRDSAPLHGGLFGAIGKTLTMTRFELILEAGVGLLNGQGSDPEIMLSFSDDGGKTFGTEEWAKVGESGHFQQEVYWTGLGSFKSRIIRIRASDPVAWSIHSARAFIEVGI